MERVEKLVNKHIHMRSKEIAYLIKENFYRSNSKKDKEKHTFQESPYINNENDEFYRLNKTTIYNHID